MNIPMSKSKDGRYYNRIGYICHNCTYIMSQEQESEYYWEGKGWWICPLCGSGNSEEGSAHDIYE